jgi:hypothetical protein
MRLSRFRTRAAQPKAGHAQSPRRCQPRHAGHAPPGTAGRAGQGLLRRRAMQAMVGKHGGQSRPGRRISLAASWPRPGRVLVSPGEPPQHKYDKPFFSRCPTPLKQGRPWNWWFGPPETNLTPHTSLVPALRVPRAVPRTIGGRWSLASSLSRTCATTRGGGLPIYGLDAAGGNKAIPGEAGYRMAGAYGPLGRPATVWRRREVEEMMAGWHAARAGMH